MSITKACGCFVLCLLASCYETALACTGDGAGQSLLGKFHSQVPANEALALLITPHDIDIKITRKINEKASISYTPPSRNGHEFIYIAPRKINTEIELCIFSKYRYASPGRYTITRLTGLDEKLLHGIELMDKGAQAWSEQSRDSKGLAIAYFDQVAKLGINRFNLSDYARLHSLNARILEYRYKYALTLAKEILTRVKEKPYLKYSAYWGKGQIQLRQNKPKQAIKNLSRAIALAESLPSQSLSAKDIADMKNLLAEAYLMDGHINTGKKLIDEAMVLAANDHRLLGAMYNNLGYTSILEGNRTTGLLRMQHINKSIGEHKLAREYSQKAGDFLELLYIENNLANLYQRVGSVRQAREHYWQALNLIGHSGSAFMSLIIYGNLGMIYQYLGDYQKSESFLNKALNIANQSQSSPFLSSLLQCRLGNTQRLMGKAKTALIKHNLCARYAIEENNRELLIKARYELAEDYIHLNNIPNARKNSALIIDQLNPEIDGDTGLYSQVLAQYAKLQRLEGNFAHALTHITSALKYSRASRNPTLRIKILREVMQLYTALNQNTRALTYGQQALNEIEQLHQYLEAERLGPAWSKTTHETYLDVAEILLSQYQSTADNQVLYQALDVIERSRALTLRQKFNTADKPKQDKAETEHLLALSELANNHANHNTSHNTSHNTTHNTNSSYTPLPLSYYHEHELLDYARLKGQTNAPLHPTLNYRQIQEKLGEKQMVLYYLTLKNALYVFTITKADISLHRLGQTDKLNQLIMAARDMMADINKSPYQGLASLSRLLLARISIPANTEELILVPHRNLHSLPFAALPLTAALPAYKPLNSRFALRVIPSLTSYFMKKKNTGRDKHSLDLAMFADPRLSPLTGATEQATADSRALQSWSGKLPPLPWTAREAANLKKTFPQTHYQMYTGAAANRHNLWSKEVRNARILHIASHGYFHSLNSDNIGFALSADQQKEQTESGFITLTELFSFRFNNELVVISGCDTGMGKEMDGEGMLGLSRGFIAQGAKHVISTLWPVADMASAKFMQLFYQRLKQLGAVDRALSAAQTDMRAIPAYRHPFYWAAYVLNTVSPEQSLIIHRTSSSQAK